MPFEHKELSGSLFKNKRKETPNQPDYTGSAKIEGVEYWVSAWIKVPQSGGDKYMSFALTEKDAPSRSPSDPPAIPPIGDFDDDDVPF
jgi:hypothetical protein